MQEQRLIEAEALIERMFLSELNYDVFLYEENELDQFSADISFYNNHESVQFYDIRLQTVYDVKQLIKMILHIGVQYYNYLSLDDEFETHLNDYPLLSGFDFGIGKAPVETTIRVQKNKLMKSIHRKQILTAIRIGLVANIALALFKLIFGYLGNAQALISDGLNSSSDVLISLMMLLALKNIDKKTRL